MQIYRPAVNNLSSQTRPTTDHPQSPQIPAQDSPGDSRATRGLGENPARNISANSDPNIKLIRLEEQMQKFLVKNSHWYLRRITLLKTFNSSISCIYWHQINAVSMEIQAQRQGKTGFLWHCSMIWNKVTFLYQPHLISDINTPFKQHLIGCTHAFAALLPQINYLDDSQRSSDIEQRSFSPYYHYISLAKGLSNIIENLSVKLRAHSL